jgi:Ca2+:H+ antiporter
MVESSDGPTFFERAYASFNIFGTGTRRPVLPLTNECARHDDGRTSANPPTNPGSVDHQPKSPPIIKGKHDSEKSSPPLPPPAPPPIENDNGAAVAGQERPILAIRFYKTCKDILLSSWLNILLISVPVGIAVEVAGVNPTIVFAVNAVAIIPLAGLLSFATQSIASDLGDTIGALMNVTFGNAVELIIL